MHIARCVPVATHTHSLYYLDQQMPNIFTVMSISQSTPTYFDVLSSYSGRLFLYLRKLHLLISIINYKKCTVHTSRYTLKLCNTFCFPTAKIVTRTRLNVTFYIHCLFCYLFAPQWSMCFGLSELLWIICTLSSSPWPRVIGSALFSLTLDIIWHAVIQVNIFSVRLDKNIIYLDHLRFMVGSFR